MVHDQRRWLQRFRYVGRESPRTQGVGWGLWVSSVSPTDTGPGSRTDDQNGRQDGRGTGREVKQREGEEVEYYDRT